MSKKYLPASPHSTMITNDLFLAAFLVSVGCTLERIEKNERRRVSFVFAGERVRELREAYRTGPVHVDMCEFRGNLNALRDHVGRMVTEQPCLDKARQPPEERSAAHAHEHAAPRVSRFPSYAHA